MKQMLSTISNRSGQSIVQSLIGIGIMGISMAAFVSMLSSQHTQIQLLQQRLAIADFQVQLTRTFSAPGLCKTILANPASQVGFVAPNGVLTSANPGTQALSMQSLLSGASPSSPVVASAGSPISPINPSVVVSQTNPFQLTNIVGSSSGGFGSYTATFQVNFDQSRLVQALKPASTLLTLYTTSAGANQTVVGCNSVSETGEWANDLPASNGYMQNSYSGTGCESGWACSPWRSPPDDTSDRILNATVYGPTKLMISYTGEYNCDGCSGSGGDTYSQVRFIVIEEGSTTETEVGSGSVDIPNSGSVLSKTVIYNAPKAGTYKILVRHRIAITNWGSVTKYIGGVLLVKALGN